MTWPEGRGCIGFMFNSLNPYPADSTKGRVWLEGAAAGATLDALDSIWVMLEQIRFPDDRPRFDQLTHGQIRGRCRTTAFPFLGATFRELERLGVVRIEARRHPAGRPTAAYVFTGDKLPPSEQVLAAVVRAAKEGKLSPAFTTCYFPDEEAKRSFQKKPNPEAQPEEMPAA